jgi:hypothetical protein
MKIYCTYVQKTWNQAQKNHLKIPSTFCCRGLRKPGVVVSLMRHCRKFDAALSQIWCGTVGSEDVDIDTVFKRLCGINPQRLIHERAIKWPSVALSHPYESMKQPKNHLILYFLVINEDFLWPIFSKMKYLHICTYKSMFSRYQLFKSLSKYIHILHYHSCMKKGV